MKRAAYESRWPRGTDIGATVTSSEFHVPPETLIAATPASWRWPATLSWSSTVNPPARSSSALQAPEERDLGGLADRGGRLQHEL